MAHPTLIVPAYQPDAGLVEALSNLRNSFSHIIVVNDGSPRQCQPIFDTLKCCEGVTVLEHAVNLGKGAALKTAFNHILLRDPLTSGVVTMDADGQHCCDDVRRVALALSHSPQSLSLGVRDFKHGTPWKSYVGNMVTRRFFRFFTRLNVRDTQTGLRGIPLQLLPRLLTIESNGYDFEMEMLFAAQRMAVEIAEVPVRTIYVDNNRKSHFDPLTDSAKIVFALFRHCVGRDSSSCA